MGVQEDLKTMPIYEYACQKCGHEFEYLLRGGESPVCPECHDAKQLSKRFSVPAAHTGGMKSLPVCDTPPQGGGCGLPQCGMGGCQGGF
jgi:putative FmdB family regulatory protein